MSGNDRPEAAVDQPADEDSSAEPKKPKKSQGTLIVELALERYELVHTRDDEPYALPRRGPQIALALGGRRSPLRRQLAASYFDRYGSAPSSSGLADAWATLEGVALRGRLIDAALRVGRAASGELVLDLGRDDGLAAIVGADGWRLATTPIIFRRTALTGLLPKPAGDLQALDTLWSVMNVAVEDRPLVLAALIAGLTPEIDHPVIGFLGEAGSGKTIAARTCVSLLDASPVPLRAMPRELADWVVGAAGSWMVGIDNVSRLDQEQSDWLCRASSGDGLVRRQLHTDSDLAVLSFRRCIVLTSIEPGVLHGDLAQRLVAVELERLAPEERRPTSELGQLLEQRRPAFLGGLLTLASRALAELSEVDTPELPRLADFGRCVAAVDRVLGTNGFARLASLDERLAENLLEGDEVAVEVLRRVRDPFGDGYLRGTATELLEALTPEKPSRGWPRTPTVFSHRLRRLAPSFRAAGVPVYFDRTGGTGQRIVEIGSRVKSASQASAASQTAWLSDADRDAPGPESVTRDAPGVTHVTHRDASPERVRHSDLPRNQADAAPSPSICDARDSDHSPRTWRERGSVEWIATATPAEIDAWAAELEAGGT